MPWTICDRESATVCASELFSTTSSGFNDTAYCWLYFFVHCGDLAEQTTQDGLDGVIGACYERFGTRHRDEGVRNDPFYEPRVVSRDGILLDLGAVSAWIALEGSLQRPALRNYSRNLYVK